MVAISSWNPRKMLQGLNIFGEILDIHQVFLTDAMPQIQSWPPGHSRSRSPRLFPSPWPTCVSSTPLHGLKVVKIFSWKTFKTGSKGAPTNVQAICFEGNHAVLYRSRMSFAQHVGWNNASFRF